MGHSAQLGAFSLNRKLLTVLVIWGICKILLSWLFKKQSRKNSNNKRWLSAQACVQTRKCQRASSGVCQLITAFCFGTRNSIQSWSKNYLQDMEITFPPTKIRTTLVVHLSHAVFQTPNQILRKLECYDLSHHILVTLHLRVKSKWDIIAQYRSFVYTATDQGPHL